MSKNHTASSIIEEARDWADEVLDDYAYKNRYISKRGRNNVILNNLQVNHFSFALQVMFVLFSIIICSSFIFSAAISILILVFLFCIQVPLICWTCLKLFNGR